MNAHTTVKGCRDSSILVDFYKSPSSFCSRWYFRQNTGSGYFTGENPEKDYFCDFKIKAQTLTLSLHVLMSTNSSNYSGYRISVLKKWPNIKD